MSEWLRALERASERGLDAVVVTVVSGKGSTPREPGAKMVVTADAFHGTIGGGELEYQALGTARAVLQARDDATPSHSRRFPLGANLGQYCGGAADLLFERVPPNAEWVRVAAAWQDAGERCVAVTPGAGDGRLLVRADKTIGSLGDGGRDAAATEIARRMLAGSENTLRIDLLGDATTALFEPLAPVEFNIVLLGAGHVGRALVKVLGTLACRVTWVDSRVNEFPRDPPDNVRVVLTETPLEEIGKAPAGAYFLVMTHSHAIDFDLVEEILARADFAFCGMIGSQTKRRTFENRFLQRGGSPERLARLTCPIGIAGIKGKEPATIAIAIAAQLLAERERAAVAKTASR
jgi:xanthine dehydrogenase accessory factor